MKPNKNISQSVIRKDAEDRMRDILNSPGLKEAMQLAADVRANFKNIIEPIVKSLNSGMFSADKPMIYVSTPRPVTYKEVEIIVKENIEGVLRRQHTTSEEIIFTKDKELLRIASGRQIKHSFAGNKKRLVVFEALIDANNYISTPALQRLAECPTQQALRKIVESINKEIRMKLRIKVSLIEGRPGFGYRINKNLSVILE